MLHDKIKKLDFSGGFLSVIRNLVGVLFQNTPLRVLQPNPKRSHQATKTPIFTAIPIKTNFKTFLIIENGSKTPQKPFFFFFF
ncbi:hypothetical protein BB453_01605 [Helicobacter pylori]|nr:hypothetical protein BB453_01605 [Helicobacter pylori]